MRTNRTMITIAGFSLIGMLRIYVALIKEKNIASIKNPVPMRTIRTMNMTAFFIHDRDEQNLCRIKQRKGHCFFQISSDDVDDKDDDLITPYTFQDFHSKCNHQKQTPLLKPVCRFVRFFQRNQKSTRLRAFRA